MTAAPDQIRARDRCPRCRRGIASDPRHPSEPGGVGDREYLADLWPVFADVSRSRVYAGRGDLEYATTTLIRSLQSPQVTVLSGRLRSTSPPEILEMSQDFFPDVPGPIPFGGLGSDDPLSFKVYQPDRLVLGKRMEDHLRIAVCCWHSFNWPGSDVFGAGTFDRPWLDARLDPLIAALAGGGGVGSSRSSVLVLCFPAGTVAPEGRTFAETTTNLRTMVTSSSPHAADRRPPLWLRQTCSAIHATPPAPQQPRSGGLRLRRAVKAMLGRHTAGAAPLRAVGGREGYEPS